jgi:hypothetical protein
LAKAAKAWGTHGMVSYRINGKSGAPGRTEESREGCDLKIYPNDANGDVLRRMQARGDDLARPRNIDFTVVFVDAVSAEHLQNTFVRWDMRFQWSILKPSKTSPGM